MKLEDDEGSKEEEEEEEEEEKKKKEDEEKPWCRQLGHLASRTVRDFVYSQN